MAKRVLIIGGYGNFGGIIARRLALDPNIQVIVGGRSLAKAQKFIATLKPAAPEAPEAVAIDIHGDVAEELDKIKPFLVIHTTGPFQSQAYTVLEACLRVGCHYIDLADARHFVAGITRYDQMAKEEKILAVSGASSVPCLTAAIIDEHLAEFGTLERVDYGIAAAQQAIRGAATASGVLSYLGEPFTTLVDGRQKTIYGWQDLHTHKYSELGFRLLGNCDIPDLELFPERYPQLRTIRFSAGTELAPLQVGLWLLSWAVRSGLVPPIESLAPVLLKIARLFDFFGSKRSGFHMLMYGTGKHGVPMAKSFYIIARSNHGVNIPCIPAIVLAKKLARGELTETGARPCLDLIDLKTYLAALKGLDIAVLRDVPVTPMKAAPAKKVETKTAAPANATPVATDHKAHSYRDDPAVPSFPDDKPLFIFDGVCVLCSRGAAWIMRGKKGDEFRFASMQSPLGQALYKHYGIPVDDTYLLIHNGVPYTKSDGYIHIAGILGGAWVYCRVLTGIPREWRDKLYDYVTRKRYRWFGKVETVCELIPEKYRENMLG